MSFFIQTGSAFVIATMIFFSQLSHATIPQPSYDITTETELFPNRPLAVVKITNRSRTRQIVYLTPDEDSNTLRMIEQTVVVEPGQTSTINFPFTYATSSRQDRYFLFHVNVNYASRPDAPRKQAASIHRPIEKLASNNFEETTDLIFMRKNLKPLLVEGVYYDGRGQINRGAGVVEAVTIPENTFELTALNNMDPLNLPPVEKIRGLKPKEMSETLRINELPKGSTLKASDHLPIVEPLTIGIPKMNLLESRGCTNPGPVTGCKKGVLFYSTLFGAIKSAGWGFSVEYWELVTPVLGSQKQWHLIGSTEVEPDGTWELQPTFGYQAESLKMYTYKMSNRFFTLYNPTKVNKLNIAEPYSWSEFVTPKKTNMNTWNETSTFFKMIPLDANSGLKLGRILYSAMRLWSRMVANGINPISSISIPIYFPNALANPLKKCFSEDANGATIAWSCSTGLGHIWIIPEHANLETVVHELGHTINRNMWKSVWPANAGGAHSISGCYHQSLAMTEGFADFLPYWVKYQPGEPTPTLAGLGGNVETYSQSCTDGLQNEMAVAATLWDLYDWQQEQATPIKYDVINYESASGVLVDYLQTPFNTINEMRTKTMAKHSVEIQKWIYDMFALNNTLVQ